jgi:fucose 4-O-acetylase-like acetyltransferase
MSISRTLPGPAAPALTHPNAAHRHARRSRPRDPWLDNTKAVLITLVVVGHVLGRGLEQRMGAAHALYVFIYLFHMPAFVFLAGHLGGAGPLTERGARKLVERLLAPYVVFTVLYSAARHLASDHPLRIDLLDPWWLLWFLPALAAWRLLTPVVLALRAPVLVALALGLGVGMFERVGGLFTLSRIVALLPFYVLGAVTTPQLLSRLRDRASRVSGWVVLLATAGSVVVLHDRIDDGLSALLWNSGYTAMHLGTVDGVVTRAGCYFAGTVLTLAVLGVVPSRATPLTVVGTRSLYVYLLHGFLIRAASVAGLLDVVTGPGALTAACAAGIAATWLLASGPVSLVTRPLVEPRLGWLMRAR